MGTFTGRLNVLRIVAFVSVDTLRGGGEKHFPVLFQYKYRAIRTYILNGLGSTGRSNGVCVACVMYVNDNDLTVFM